MVPNLNSVITSVQMNFGVGMADETVILPEDGSIVAIPFGESTGIDLAWRKDNENPAVPLLAETILNGLGAAPLAENAEPVML